MPRHSSAQTLTLLHPIYSPKGGIEGAFVEIDGQPAQVVFKPEPPLEEGIAALREGEGFRARIEASKPSDKGESEHPVYELLELVEVPDARPGTAGTASVGKVVRFNYARHGEPNGVVLDNGDFVHLRPDGQRQARLAIGDQVEAAGEARPLRFGSGRVIEATRVNGVEITKPKPKPHRDRPAGL